MRLRSVGTNQTGTLKTFDFLAAPLNFYFSIWDRWHFIMSFTCYLFTERCMKIFNLPTAACPFSVCLEMVPNGPPLIKTQHTTTQLKGYQQGCEVPHRVRAFHGEDFNESAVITVGCSQKGDMRLWEIWHKSALKVLQIFSPAINDQWGRATIFMCTITIIIQCFRDRVSASVSQLW